MTFARIRMFRQGLGDSFLLTFPGDAADVNVLIDFGVLLGTPDAKKKMQAMALDIVKATNGKLDYLVATHEHWDHVSGFAQAEDELAKEKLTVGEVWVAWTEKPGEPLAEELRGRRAAVIAIINRAFSPGYGSSSSEPLAICCTGPPPSCSLPSAYAPRPVSHFRSSPAVFCRSSTRVIT